MCNMSIIYFLGSFSSVFFEVVCVKPVKTYQFLSSFQCSEKGTDLHRAFI